MRLGDSHSLWMLAMKRQDSAMRNHWPALFISCVLVIAGRGSLVAQEAPEHSAELQPRIAKLISQLADDDFVTREQASASLLNIGEPGLAQLKAQRRAATREVRYRLKLILERIEEQAFAERSKSFLLDLDPAHSYGLPAWETFRDLVGSTRTSKLIFLDLIHRQYELAELIDDVSNARKEEVASRDESAAAWFTVQESEKKLAAHMASTAGLLRKRQLELRDLHIGDFAGLLLAVHAIDSQAPIEVNEVVGDNVYGMLIGSYMVKQGYGSCLRKLLSAWIPKTHSAMAIDAMDISLRHNLPEGAQVARRHLSANLGKITREFAFRSLARFGDETDIPTLASFLEDATVVDEFKEEDALTLQSDIHESDTPPPGAPAPTPTEQRRMVVRISDYALVTAMLLSGEDPKSVFPRFEPDARLGFSSRSLACPLEESQQRTRQIMQWKKRRLPASSDG